MRAKNIWDIEENEFINIVINSKTWTEILKKCGYSNFGNNKTVRKRISKLNLNVEHLLLCNRDKIKQKVCKYELRDILIQDSTYSSSTILKRRLIRELNWEHRCSKCGLSEWMEEEIPIELDHINGNNRDNRIKNLRFLCPNCHAKTDTYRGKNVKNTEKDINNCIDCSKEVFLTSIRCKECCDKKRFEKGIRNKPTLEQLKEDLSKMTYVSVGKKYKVSDTCIRKWIRKYVKYDK